MENDIRVINTKQEELIKVYEDRVKSMEYKHMEMEKRYDIKLETYFEEVEKLVTQKIENSKRSFTNRVDNLMQNNIECL